MSKLDKEFSIPENASDSSHYLLYKDSDYKSAEQQTATKMMRKLYAQKVRLPHRAVSIHMLSNNKRGEKLKSYISELKILKQMKLPFSKVNKDTQKERHHKRSIESHAIAHV